MSTKVNKNSDSRKIRYGFAVWDSDAQRYFPIRALNLSNVGFPNIHTFRFGAPGFVHERRLILELTFGCSVIVYPV